MDDPARPLSGITYTVARARDATLAKRVTAKADGNGHVIRGYDNGFLFRFEKGDARDVADFARQLLRLSNDRTAAVLRGSLAPHVLAAGPAGAFRRKAADPDPALNSVVPASRTWVAVDADDVPARAGMNWLQDVPGASVYLVSLLPPELSGVAFAAQVTGSAGFTGDGHMRLRLWFALTAFVSDSDLKRWANAWNAKARTHLIDPSIYGPVQLHYTARPVLGRGVADPTKGRRWFLVPGPRDRATLTIPPTVTVPAARGTATQTDRAVRPVSFDQWLALIGDPLQGFWRPINGAIGTGVASGIVAPAIVSAIRSAVLAAEPGHRAAGTILRYADSAFLTREVAAIGRRDAAQRQQITVLRRRIFTPRLSPDTNQEHSP